MQKPRHRQVNIELPPDLEAIYANFALITHSSSEVIIDFARVLPNAPKHKVHARIVTTPHHAKLLLQALTENLSKFEAKYGEIKTDGGDDLAQQFFGATKPPQSPESQ